MTDARRRDVIEQAIAWMKVNELINTPIPTPLYELVRDLAFELVEARQKLTELGQ
jgi:hypothetical protein